jgi:hypothetical protein
VARFDDPPPDRRLDQAAETAILLHHQQRAKLFLEAAIGALIDSFGYSAAIQIIEASAQHLRDHE